MFGLHFIDEFCLILLKGKGKITTYWLLGEKTPCVSNNMSTAVAATTTNNIITTTETAPAYSVSFSALPVPTSRTGSASSIVSSPKSNKTNSRGNNVAPPASSKLNSVTSANNSNSVVHSPRPNATTPLLSKDISST